jgi:hypothetical protein
LEPINIIIFNFIYHSVSLKTLEFLSDLRGTHLLFCIDTEAASSDSILEQMAATNFEAK